MEKDEMLGALRDYLTKIPAGRIVDPRELVSHLAPCWEQFEGWNTEGMEAYKLGRMEDAIWDPPCLEFTIERHGGTVMGSSRAALHRWTVDLDHTKAGCDTSYSYRQIYKRESPLNVGPIADDLAQKIIHGTEDPRLKWKSDSLVQVRIGKVISATTGLAKQTLIGRRKRFRAALEAQLHQSGWEVAGQNTYAKGDGR